MSFIHKERETRFRRPWKDATHPYDNSTNTPRCLVASVCLVEAGRAPSWVSRHARSTVLRLRHARSRLPTATTYYPAPRTCKACASCWSRTRVHGVQQRTGSPEDNRITAPVVWFTERTWVRYKVETRRQTDVSDTPRGVPAPIVRSKEPRPCQDTTRYTLLQHAVHVQ